MPKYIDVEKLDLAPNADGAMNGVLFVSRDRSGGKTAAMVHQALKQMIDAAPAEDVVKVVRCRECRLEGTAECPMVHKDSFFGNLYAETNSEDFCSRGKRR